jgi:hypothetical protein
MALQFGHNVAGEYAHVWMYLIYIYIYIYSPATGGRHVYRRKQGVLGLPTDGEDVYGPLVRWLNARCVRKRNAPKLGHRWRCNLDTT